MKPAEQKTTGREIECLEKRKDEQSARLVWNHDAWVANLMAPPNTSYIKDDKFLVIDAPGITGHFSQWTMEKGIPPGGVIFRDDIVVELNPFKLTGVDTIANDR